MEVWLRRQCLVRPRHAEDVLGQVAKDEVGGDGCDLVEAGFAKLALDVELLGKAEAAMGLNAGFRCFPARLGRQHFRHVGLGTGVVTGFIAVHRLVQHQLRSPHTGIGLGDGKLNTLVLPDWTSEDDALTGVAAGALDDHGIPDALCGNKNSFGIHAKRM